MGSRSIRALAVAVAALVLVAQSVSFAADLDRAAAAGEELSFIGPDGGVWLADVARGPVRLLLAQGEFTSYHWSPDGRRIAYRAADGGLSVLDTYSGRRQRLAEPNVDSIAWSPDGERIAYSRDQQLWVTPSRGGAPTRVTEWTPEEGDRLLVEPVWSADGRNLYYGVGRARGPASLGAYDFSNRRSRDVTVGHGAGSIDAPIITPDGRALVIPYSEPGTGDSCGRPIVVASSATGAPSGAARIHGIELITLPALDRQHLACWEAGGAPVEAPWMNPVFVRDGAVTVMPSSEAPAGLVALDRDGRRVEPKSLGFGSLAEEAGRLERRYPTEVVSNGRTAALAYRQDEPHPDGVWFSFELHLVDTGSGFAPQRSVLLRDGCMCPDDQAETNIGDLRLSPDGSRVAFTYFQMESNIVSVASMDGTVRTVADGERPVWRPKS